ncbi:uncharacterized protein LOC114732252 [Neltuma alba]|uniref:uncharacterized protein LOC114732252 n=1 Tax=Neltuma alba TaxID=207710 RepID=UPI0010A56EE2|nr:uncharacterized protein LOC114732252 [Prosopis alba]
MASYLDFFPQQPEREQPEQQEYEEEEEEEALSLCDLPLNHDVTKRCSGVEVDDTASSRQSRRSSLSEAMDFFEFFNDATSDMRSADDIVFCGKLFKDTDRSPPKSNMKDLSRPPVYRRRSESLSTLQSGVTRSNSATTCGNSRRLMMRNSRSLDYRRLHRSSSSIVMPAAEIERNPSVRSAVHSDIVVKKSIKPRWFFLFFGIVRVPSEMELRDIKNRQFRRNPSTTMFPTSDGSGKLAVNRSSSKVSWKILKALSCKDHTSVSVTTPFVAPQTT